MNQISSIKDEKVFVNQLIKLSDRDEFMLQTKWALKYTDYLSKGTSRMEMIDNRLLLEDTSISVDMNVTISPSGVRLRRNLQKDQDYVYLNEYAWTFVRAMYGGGPQLKQDMTQRDTPQSNLIKV